MRSALIGLLVIGCSGSEKASEPPKNQADKVEPAPTKPPPTRDEELDKARKEADEARKDADEAMQKVERLMQDLEALDKRVTDAVDSVVAAQNDADRAAAKAKLEQLRKDKAEMEQRIQDAKAAAAKARRQGGMKVSKECQDNPLAKGCS